MPGDESRTSTTEGKQGTKPPPAPLSITPKPSHFQLDDQTFNDIRQLVYQQPIDKNSFFKELREQLHTKQKRMTNPSIRNILHHAASKWEMSECRPIFVDRNNLIMNCGGIYIMYVSHNEADYEPVRNASSYIPTVENITKYMSLKYTGVRTPSVFQQDAPVKTEHVSPAIIIEENGLINRLVSLCGKDIQLQALVSAYIANENRRSNIMFYICQNSNKPSLITALSYLLPLSDVVDLIENNV